MIRRTRRLKPSSDTIGGWKLAPSPYPSEDSRASSGARNMHRILDLSFEKRPPLLVRWSLELRWLCMAVPCALVPRALQSIRYPSRVDFQALFHPTGRFAQGTTKKNAAAASVLFDDPLQPSISNPGSDEISSKLSTSPHPMGICTRQAA